MARLVWGHVRFWRKGEQCCPFEQQARRKLKRGSVRSRVVGEPSTASAAEFQTSASPLRTDMLTFGVSVLLAVPPDELRRLIFLASASRRGSRPRSARAPGVASHRPDRGWPSPPKRELAEMAKDHAETALLTLVEI